jgi:hypothetical protein
MFKTLIRSLACVLGLAGLTCCHSTPPLEAYQTEEFDLAAAPAAAEGYPMEIMEGRFMTSDGKSFTVSPSFLEGDWGLSAIGYVGDPLQPAPDSLELRWFSFPEDKLYEGYFALPQRQLYALLKQGYYNTDERKHETYHTMTVCVLPKGVVVVWLSGENQVLIGRYQGYEVPFTQTEFERQYGPANRERMIRQERAKLPAQVQEEIRTGTLSTRQWDEYLKTYPWKMEVVEQVGTQSQPRTEPLQLYHHWMRYLNAERVSHPTANTKEARAAYLNLIRQPTPKALPKYFGLFVQNKYNEKHEVRIDSLNEAETIAAFQTVSRGLEKEPLTLRVEVNKAYSTATLTLTNGFRTVPLTKAVVKIFDED